jgi:hypothetical protein
MFCQEFPQEPSSGTLGEGPSVCSKRHANACSYYTIKRPICGVLLEYLMVFMSSYVRLSLVITHKFFSQVIRCPKIVEIAENCV